jgi:tetratricopeptide (TPR) repeat protein
MKKFTLLAFACGLALGLTQPAALVAADTKMPLFDGLGFHTRKVTTASPEAQLYFDQGLALLYGFNHGAAIRAFQQAAQLDPACAMAWWGVAIACGPHINLPLVPPDRAALAWAALTEAQKHLAAVTPVERALIAAQLKRYANPQPENRQPLDEAYAAAMRVVWQANPQDADIGALFAEAMMDLRPWDLWQPDGKPQPGTDEIVATLEQALARMPSHPLALHLYIHAVEASPHPEKADAAADRLRHLEPGIGHMVHMPSHIDVLRGRWAEAIAANEEAIVADRGYRAQVPGPHSFLWMYSAHNRHMLAYAALMCGRSELALRQIRTMAAEFPADFWAEWGPIADGYCTLPYETLVRFGRWDEILAEPDPGKDRPASRAIWRTARGIACAALGRTTEARAEQKEFLALRGGFAADASFGNNTVPGILDVAEHMLAGEILFREGKVDAGLDELREAVRREDLLRYDEPPDWMLPVRHSLGASLMQAGRYAEAEQVYRADLKKTPDNGWSLYGLADSLEVQGKKAEAKKVRARFAEIWARADTVIKSSCFCQPGQ